MSQRRWTAIVAALAMLAASCAPAGPSTPALAPPTASTAPTPTPVPPTATTAPAAPGAAQATAAPLPVQPPPSVSTRVPEAADLERTGDRVKGLVDVGGHRLYIDCAGSGSPAVVLDAGASGSSGDWSAVAPELSKSTRVCAYDRANRGKSDAGPAVNTAEQMVKDLHALLTGAGIAAPYVLVGQSFGGVVAQLYAIRYPAETAGLVLVDSAHAEGYAARNDASATRPPVAGGVDIRESGRQVLAAGPLPPVRLVVLSRGRPEPGVGPSEEQWTQWQRELAAAVAGSSHVVVENAGHNIHTERPQAVVDAVRRVLPARG